MLLVQIYIIYPSTLKAEQGSYSKHKTAGHQSVIYILLNVTFFYPPSNIRSTKSFFIPFFYYFPNCTCVVRVSYITWTRNPYTSELGQLMSSDEYVVWFYYVLGHTTRISYVIWTHDPCSYKLEQLASIDDTETDFYMYWVPLHNNNNNKVFKS